MLNVNTVKKVKQTSPITCDVIITIQVKLIHGKKCMKIQNDLLNLQTRMSTFYYNGSSSTLYDKVVKVEIHPFLSITYIS